MQSSSEPYSALPLLTAVVIAGAGLVWGKLLYRRREEAQDSLTIAQRDVQTATAAEIWRRIERDEVAEGFQHLRDRLSDLKGELAEAHAKAAKERTGLKMLELENERLHAQHKCDEETIRRLGGGGGEGR